MCAPLNLIVLISVANTRKWRLSRIARVDAKSVLLRFGAAERSV